MLYLASTQFLVALLLFTISIAFFWPPKTRTFTRRGWDPGLWGLKMWPARLYFFFKGHDIVETAYRDAKDTPYLLQTLIEDVLVLPPKYFLELRMLPGSKLSASHALVVSVLGQYSGVDVILKDRQAYDVTRSQLTKSLPNLLPALSQKADQVLSERLASCTASDYTEIKVQDMISDLVLRTTPFAFVGPKLAENTELHELIDIHPKLVRDIAVSLLFVPSFMRRWVYFFLPPSIRMRSLHRRMREILFGEAGAAAERDEQSFKTLIQHLIETSSSPIDEDDIVAKFLVVTGAALHTMTMSLIHAIIDLCAHPAYTPSLSSEVALHLPSLVPPQWSIDAIARLKKLDAFLKESQRFNPPKYLSFDRLALTPITLSTGITIPRRTYICMAAGNMAKDASFYPSATVFSPKRFHSVAPETSKKGKNLDFVSTETGNVHWGSGRFTCPGRWYASAVMKAVIALIVRKYDVKFPKGQVERLPNVYMDVLVEPNPGQAVLCRRR